MNLPEHIGFIVDGNRRWASQRGLVVSRGHQEGYRALKDVLIDVLHRGVRYVSAYIFSTENWKRSESEVRFLLDLLVRGLERDIPTFVRENVRLKVLGSRQDLSPRVIKAIERAERETAHLDGGELLLCFNYGGKAEIVDAVKKIVQSGISPDEVTENLIEQNIYAPEVPPCDVIVRTSGEKRLSNYMLWRSAYSELIFVDKNWPDMTTDDVSDILDEYASRQRRYGK